MYRQNRLCRSLEQQEHKEDCMRPRPAILFIRSLQPACMPLRRHSKAYSNANLKNANPAPIQNYSLGLITACHSTYSEATSRNRKPGGGLQDLDAAQQRDVGTAQR